MDTTVWKTVKGFPRYEVSNTGLVRRKGADTRGMSPSVAKQATKEKILKPLRHAQGYQMVVLAVETPIGSPNIKKQVTIHSLVCQAFYGPRPNGYVINHIDNDPTNNNISNLEYCTQQENIQHAIRNGYLDLDKRSEAITKALSKPVERCSLDGEVLETFDSVKSTKEAGYTHTLVGKCARGIQKTHKGFIWRFKEVNK